MNRFLCGMAMSTVIATGHSAVAAKLTFENRSHVSIPLEIPGVMNPNLSPNSKSRVTLNRGQKVYFKAKGRRALLLEITDEQDGQVVVVNELVAERSAELETKE